MAEGIEENTQKSMNIVLSIDPGINGGVAVFHDGVLKSLHTIPEVAKGKVDYNELYNLLESKSKNETFGDTTIVLEEVHSVFGASAKSNFSFGHINGVLLGMIVALGHPIVLVQPKEWQKVIWSNNDKVFKPGKAKQTVDTKATSLLAAKRLFPKTDFRATYKSKVPHDGLVDACLIGKWYLMAYK